MARQLTSLDKILSRYESRFGPVSLVLFSVGQSARGNRGGAAKGELRPSWPLAADIVAFDVAFGGVCLLLTQIGHQGRTTVVGLVP
jgi:hypothetical protein